MITYISLAFFFIFLFYSIDKSNKWIRVFFLSLGLLTFIIPLWLNFQPDEKIVSVYAFNGTDYVLIEQNKTVVEFSEPIKNVHTDFFFLYIIIITLFLAIIIITYLIDVFNSLQQKKESGENYV